MRRVIVLLLCLTILTGCGSSQKEMEQPVKFYYCYRDAQSGSYGTETGALGVEIRDLGAAPRTAQEILAMYLQGPSDDTLISPFPQSVAVEQAALQNGVLTVTLSEDARVLSGIDRTAAVACLTQTMTQFSDITSVRFSVGGSFWNTGRFLLLDDTATSDAVTMKLYFGASDGNYLAEETRTNSFQSEGDMLRYILMQLAEGPADGQNRVLLPNGTRILGVQNNDGICTVNLSESFLWYQPATHMEARVMILSLVNTLTELPEVGCVQILCGGAPVSYYMGLDLREPFYRDESVLREAGQDGVDVTLYVPCGIQERLAPIQIRQEEQASVMDVMEALLSVETINSYINPFPEGTMVLSAEEADGLCTVMFNAAFAMCDSDPSQAQKAVRSTVATLCQLDGIDRVSIKITNEKLTNVDLSEPLTMDLAWLLP